MFPDDLLTSAKPVHDVKSPCVLEPALFPPDDCFDDFSPPRLFPLNLPEEPNTMNTSDDEPSSGLNGRLRPRKSAVQSPQTTKPFRRSESRSSQERPKRTSTPSKVLSKPDDLANKSDSSPIPHYLCPFCDKKFAVKQAISKHVHRMHSKQSPVMGCLFCNHAEAEPNDIIRHMVDSHPNQYFACLDCHTRFASTTELAEHKLNVCEKQKLPYRNKLRQKTGKSKKSQKSIKIDDKDFETESKTFPAGHGFNGIVISCELKPSQVHDDADIEDNITTNLILPPSKALGSNAVLDKNAVIVLDDIQWNKRIPSNFSFHNTDADQILSRLGVVHRSPRTGESTRRDWLKTLDDATQKFEKCFDTNFYSKVASNVQENLTKFLDGSFNFNPDPDSMIKTRKSKMSVVINTAEGFPILLACEQYSRNTFDGYMPRAIAPRHKWKWDSLETDRTTLSADQIKRDSHTNNCIITLVSSLDIWTQLCMRRKYEEKFSYSPLAKKTEKQTAIENELKEILESREIPSSSSQVEKYKYKPQIQNDPQDFPAFLGLAPSSPKYELPPAVLSGEWVRPRCYVCCACGTPTYDSRGLSAHMATRHPNAQVQHYEVVGELLLNADILKHLYVPPSQMHNRTRPPRGIRECTKCRKSITLEDLHQHMLDCAGDTPAVRRKCRYRPFGVRKRRPRLPDNRIRKKIRKDIRNRQNNQKAHMRARPRTNRSEVGDAETIRKMIADLPAKRHRVLVNPMTSMMRPRRKLDKHRNKLLMKRHQSDDTKNRKHITIKNKSEHSGSSTEDQNSSKSLKYDDDDDKPLKRTVRRVPAKGTRQNEAMKRKAVLNRARRKLKAAAEQASADNETPDLDVRKASAVESNQLSIENNSQRLDVNSGSYNSRENSNRGSNGDDGSNNRDQPPPGHIDQNGNSNNQHGPAPNTPLKHSIARLTADCETHDKSVQFHHAFLMQLECNNLNQHVPSGQRLPFENEAAVTKLDKPPLAHSHHGVLDPGNIQKSKQNKVKRLNDCIAMLRMKNKLTDPTPEETTSQSVQCGSEELLDRETATRRLIEDKPAEIFHRHNINDLAMDRQFERPYDYSRDGKFISAVNHTVPISSYEIIPMMMGMPQPEDLRVTHSIDTPLKPKGRRQSPRAQQRKSTGQNLDSIPPIPQFMIPGNPCEMSMVSPMPHPGQVSQRHNSSQRIIVNINTETNRPSTLDLPSPNRSSPRQVSPLQISPRQIMMNNEMMRDMSYERPSPNKLSPLQILTPEVRARSESRSPRQSHIYDPQFTNRAGHRQISPRHSLDFDPRRAAMDVYQHSTQPSTPAQISPKQVSHAHDKYSLYASKLPQMPISIRQTSPATDHKAPKQISPMQETLPYDFHSSYKIPKQVSPKQVSQATDIHPPSSTASSSQGPKSTGQAFDINPYKMPPFDHCSSKQTDQVLCTQLSSRASSLGKESTNASQPLDLQSPNKMPAPGQISSRQVNKASAAASKTPTQFQDASKYPNQVSDTPPPRKVPSPEQDSLIPAILASDSSLSTGTSESAKFKAGTAALDLQLCTKLSAPTQDSSKKSGQDFELKSSNKISPIQEAIKHASLATDTCPPKKLPSPGQGAIKETTQASDLQSSSKISSTGQNLSKPADQASEEHSSLTSSGESSFQPIIKASDPHTSDKLAPQQVPSIQSKVSDKQSLVKSAPKRESTQQENKAVEQPIARKLPIKEILSLSVSQDAKSRSKSSNLVSTKQVDQTPDVQTAIRSSLKEVKQSSQAQETLKETTKARTRQKKQSSKNSSKSATVEEKIFKELLPKPKTRASSRSSQGSVSQTRATRASSRVLKLRSSSQPEEPDPVLQKPQSQTAEPQVQLQPYDRLCESLAEKREPHARMCDPQLQIQVHQAESSHLLMQEAHPQTRELRDLNPQAREIHVQTLEHVSREQQMQEPQPPILDTHPETRKHQTREPQTRDSHPKILEHEAEVSHPQMQKAHLQARGSRDPKLNQARELTVQTKDHQTREQQMQESRQQMLDPHTQVQENLKRRANQQMREPHLLAQEHQTKEQKAQETKIEESKIRETKTHESPALMRDVHSQAREHHAIEPKTRDSQTGEPSSQEREPHSETREPHLQARESATMEKREIFDLNSESHLQTRVPLPQIGEPYTQPREPHVTAQPLLLKRECHVQTQSYAQVQEPQRQAREHRTHTREPHIQLREPQAKQDTQAYESHAQQTRVCPTQSREPQTQHSEPHVQAQHHAESRNSQSERYFQPRESSLQRQESYAQSPEPQPQLGEPQTQIRDSHAKSHEQHTQPKESHIQSHYSTKGSRAQDLQLQNRESHSQILEPNQGHSQKRELNIQPQYHSTLREPRQTGEPDISMNYIQARESHLQETQAQAQSHTQSRDPYLQTREPYTHHRELRDRSREPHKPPREPQTQAQESFSPPQEPSAKPQSQSQPRDSRTKVKESPSVSRVSFAKLQEESTQHREPHVQLRDLHSQSGELDAPQREPHAAQLHTHSRELHAQSQRDIFNHTQRLLQTQPQGTSRPYLLYAPPPPPPPPPPEDTQQVLSQLQLEARQQQWQSNVFDMSILRQSSTEGANEHHTRNMSVEIYPESEYPQMHSGIPPAHTGNLLDNLPSVPLDLSSKTPETCEHARKLETSYVSHYERYETLDLSNKNLSLSKRDEDVVVDLRVKPISQNSAMAPHELSAMPMNMDEMVDLNESIPKDLSVRQKHVDNGSMSNDQAFNVQDFSHKAVVESPTDLSGRVIPVSSHYLLNNNDTCQLQTDTRFNNTKDRLSGMSNIAENPETSNDYSEKCRNDIPSDLLSNIFVPPPPPPPLPTQENIRKNEIDKNYSMQEQVDDSSLNVPEYKIKTSVTKTSDSEETSDNLRSQANKSPRDLQVVPVKTSSTSSPGYTSPNIASSKAQASRHDEDYGIAKAFTSVSSKTLTDDSTETPILNFFSNIPSTTTTSTSSAYTLTSTSTGTSLDTGKPSELFRENASKIDSTEQDPETAKKIALLPKELVEILGNMPPDHRNQLLNVLPQYVSHPKSSAQSNCNKQVGAARSTSDLSKIPLPAGSGPSLTTFVQNNPVSKFETAMNYQNQVKHLSSDTRFSIADASASKLNDTLDSDVKHDFSLSSIPPQVTTVNKSDDIKPAICGQMTISENKIEVINLETSETTTEVYNNPPIIDLTEDDNSTTNPIVNVVKTPEGIPPNIVLTPTILPTVNLSNVNKVKGTNEKTSSLRAVRIKTPSERHKSVPADVQVTKTILDKDSTLIDDSELSLRKTLAIQQSEVSSTQQQKKDAVKLSSQLSPTVTKQNNETAESVIIQHDIPAEQQTMQDETEYMSVRTKAVLVTSSISTTGLLVDKQSLNKIVSSDLQVNLTPCELDNTLAENQKIKITVSDHSIQSTSALVKEYIDEKTNAKQKKILQEENEDSDDDVSLAVIVKQKQLDQHSSTEGNVIDTKTKPERKKRKKEKHMKTVPASKEVIHKELTESLNSTELVDSASKLNEDSDKIKHTEELTLVKNSIEANINIDDEEKHSKKKSKKSRRGKKISTTSITNAVDLQKQDLHECVVDHNSVSSSSNKTYEGSCMEVDVTNEVTSDILEDERPEIDFSQNKNKTKKKIVPKLSQSPLPINPLKTKKISSDYENSTLEKDQDETIYDSKRIVEPDSCSIIELSDTQDSLMQDSVNTEESNSESATESKKNKKIIKITKSKKTEMSNDCVQSSHVIDTLTTPLRRSRRGKSLFVSKLSDSEGIVQECDIYVEQKAPLTKKQLIFSKLLLDEENTKPQEILTLEKLSENPESLSNIPHSPELNEHGKERDEVNEIDVKKDIKEKHKAKETDTVTKNCEKDTESNTSKNNLAIIDEPKILEKEPCLKESEKEKNLEKDTGNERTKQTSEKNKATKRRQSPQVKRKVKKPKPVESSEHTLEDIDTISSPQQDGDSESKKVNMNITKSKKDTLVNTDLNEATNELVNSEDKIKLEINKPSSAEKRKNSEYMEVEQITKNKKCKFNNRETIRICDVTENDKTITDKSFTQEKNSVRTNTEVRTTCYKPVAARRTRSKSAVVKSCGDLLYDPYDIDLDDMIEVNEPIFTKKGKCSVTTTVSSSYSANTSTPIQNTAIRVRSKVTTNEDQTLHDEDFEEIDNDLIEEDIRGGNISDSDDSSKSDVPLQKYVEEKGKRISSITPSKELDDDTDIEQELSGDKNNSNDSKSSRKTLAVCNSVDGGAGQSETEEQLRSEQFMESFGFFSERKPRKSNLLASKKISETFHIIANESDDVYFGYKDRSSKKLHHENKKLDESKNSKGNKKETKRGRKKKICAKPEPCYCHICKKEFKRPDNFLRHQMSLIHISKLSEVELKIKTLPIHEEPNYLIAYKQYLDRLKVLTDKLAKKKKHKGSRKIKLPTVEEILADLNKTIREQQFSQRGLSNDEALFLDCCELLQEMPIKNDKSNADTSALPNICQTSGSELQIDKNLDDTKSDGDVDSITAKTILESEEVRNLEKDLISNLKEAASANAAKSKLKYQQALAAEPTSESIEPSNNLRDAQYEQAEQMEIAEKPEKPVPEKSKREREILVDEKEFVYKEKMYPDIIEDIDMFEDKFDKIKRKCRSQAAAAKQTQVVAEPSESHKSRRKSDKKKGKKARKSHQSSHVPTKGALKGFDGVKVSISPNDIRMPTIVPPAEENEKDMNNDKDKNRAKDKDKDREKDKDMEKEKEKDREKDKDKDREKDKEKDKEKDREREKDKDKKKKKKGSSKKKRDKKDSESSGKNDSDQKDKESSTQKKVDVYEFMDNEDAELFEFRPSTLMERFKNLSKDTLSTSKSNPDADEVDISSESASDGDDFVYMSDDYVCSDDETENSLLSCEMGSGKVGKEKTSSPLKRKDVVEKNAVMGKIFKHNAVRTEKKIAKSKETIKPKANLDQLFDSLLEDEPSLPTSKGDSSPQKELTEADSYSSLPGSTYEPSSSKYEPPSRYESSKFEPSTSRFEPSSSKYESSTSTSEPSRFEPLPSTSSYEPLTSKLETTPSTSRYEPSSSKPSSSKYDPMTSRYESSTVSTRDSSEREFALPQKVTLSHRYENMPSTSKRPQRPSLQAEEFRFSPKKYDSTEEDYDPSTSKRFESNSLDEDYGPSVSKKYDIKSPKESRLMSPKKYDSRKYETETSKGNDCSKSKYSSSSMRNEDGSFKRRHSLDKSPIRKTDEGLSSTYDYGADAFEDDAGVARQRARRKCTVGKQNVLAESWSSESEPERGPPRPTSAESVLSTGGRKKKGRKKEGQPLGGRRGKVSFKRQELESRVSSSNRNTSSNAAGCVDTKSSYEEYGSGSSTSVSTGVQVSLGPPAFPGSSGVKPRSRPAPYTWAEGDDEQEHLQQHGWIVGDSHKKLVTMLAHAKGRKRNNDDKRHLVE